ncbi:MAG: CotH kinase family protein [Saprospiraceae bacterium]|nr:CotH kinase family protein [Saprospiraceae bacterium]
MKFKILLILSLVVKTMIAQDLPYFMRFSDDHKRLITGNRESKNVFDDTKIHDFDFRFSQTDYLNQLTTNYNTKKDIPASLYIDGVKYDSVGVRYKGQTSFQRVVANGKKSFNVTMNGFIKGQDHDGYETFNLNNAYEDESNMREVTYLSHNRHHIPAARSAFARVFVNGVYYGVYALVQGLDSEFINEWFLSNDGTRWRAERSVTGGGGPGGGGFGAGTSSINFLGTDTTLYKPNYTLKKSGMLHPWQDLMVASQALNQPALSQMYDTLHKVMDVDRALWFVAHEIMFGDDDSYINKGGMDYYIYFDKETGRLVPLEYDGNSVMRGMAATWSIFNKETDVKFPLASRLLKEPELRQRYLAHARVMFNEYLDKTTIDSKIEKYYALIDSSVNTGTKKIYTYDQFKTAKTDLINLITTRRNTFTANTEFKRIGPSISNVQFMTEGVQDKTPDANEEVIVNAKVEVASGIKLVRLYYGTGFDGVFERTDMFDDGKHQDGIENDGVFGGVIPGQVEGAYVRYYIEAIANDGAGTASYMPVGAEHDVFIFRVNVGKSNFNEVVINEIMASNTTTVSDQDGEFDDWIELYNTSSQTMDISGWSISDNPDNLMKFTFPDSTFIPANSYLVIWADEDGLQSGMHANFKLSASGENLYLVDKDIKIVDSMSYSTLGTDIAFARVPNGKGPFKIQTHTFNKSNDLVSANDDKHIYILKIYPNPAKNYFIVESAQDEPIEIFNSYGYKVFEQNVNAKLRIDTHDWPNGIYLIKSTNQTNKISILK